MQNSEPNTLLNELFRRPNTFQFAISFLREIESRSYLLHSHHNFEFVSHLTWFWNCVGITVCILSLIYKLFKCVELCISLAKTEYRMCSRDRSSVI